MKHLYANTSYGDFLIFFKIVFDFFSFLFLLYFYFFIKIVITSLRGRNQLEVRSPLFPVRIFSRVEIYSGVTPARLYRSRLDAAVQSSVALLGVIRCSYNPFLLGHGLRRCLKNLPTSEIEVSSVSYEQIRVATNSKIIYRSVYNRDKKKFLP